MYKLRIILKKKVREEWFEDLANKEMKIISGKSVWSASPTGKVWTHKRDSEGKVQFLRETDGTADYVKIWHTSKNDFQTARTVSDFIQWTLTRLSTHLQRIEIIVE